MWMAILFGLALSQPVLMFTSNSVARQYRIDVKIYQGDPMGSKEAGNVSVLSSPQLVTRHGQQAIISVGQNVPVISDIEKTATRQINTIKQEQVGITMRVTPKGLEDGSIFISGSISFKEVLSEASLLEQTVTFNKVYHPGQMQTIAFYHPSEYEEKRTVLPNQIVQVQRVPFKGNERWMEIIIHPIKTKEEFKPDGVEPVPMTVLPRKAVPVQVKP